MLKFIARTAAIASVSLAVGAVALIATPPKAESSPINPINREYIDCYTGLRNGALVDQSTGRPIMSASCQDYSSGQYWTVGQYVRYH